MKNAAQRIQEAKLNKNDKLYVQARAEFSSLVKEISKLKNQNNLQKSTAREFSDFSTLFNLNDDNSTNYSSGKSNDNPITSDDDIEKDVEELDLEIKKQEELKADTKEIKPVAKIIDTSNLEQSVHDLKKVKDSLK